MQCAEMARRVAIAAACQTLMLRPMPPRTRKLVGSIALIVFVGLYMALAMEATTVLFNGQPPLVQGAGYAFAGLIWILPAGAIISWMARTAK